MLGVLLCCIAVCCPLEIMCFFRMNVIWKVGKSRRVSVTNTRPSVIYKLSKQGLSCIPADSDVKVLQVLAMLRFLFHFICLNLS
jgi:hypothetical protein